MQHRARYDDVCRRCTCKHQAGGRRQRLSAAEGHKAPPAPGLGQWMQSRFISLFAESIRIESKIFFLDVRENARGLYLKISERKSVPENRATVVFPAPLLGWLQNCVDTSILRADGAGVDQQSHGDKLFQIKLDSNARGAFLQIEESNPGPKGFAVLFVPEGGPSKKGWKDLSAMLVRVQQVCNQHLYGPPVALRPVLPPQALQASPWLQLQHLGLADAPPLPGPPPAQAGQELAARGSPEAGMAGQQQFLLQPGQLQSPLVYLAGPIRYTFSVDAGQLTITEESPGTSASVTLLPEALPTLQLAAQVARGARGQ